MRITITQSDLPTITMLLGVFDTVSKDEGLSNCFVAKYLYDSPVVGEVEVSYIYGEDSLRIARLGVNGRSDFVHYSGSLGQKLPASRQGMNEVVDTFLPVARGGIKIGA